MIKNLQVEKVALANPGDIKVAIVQSTYHHELNATMTAYCKASLIANHIPENNIAVYYAPGCWEIPLLVHKLARTNEYAAIVAFGIIIKGDTYHFDMIANEVARALMNCTIDYQLPIGFEILAVNNQQQAEQRAGDHAHNKGIEASNAILHTLKTLQEIG